MDSLRVNNRIKQIEVNDAGECISIPISDTAFYERFANLMKYFDEKQADIDRRVAELSAKYPDGGNAEKSDDGEDAGRLNVDKLVDEVALYSELCMDICGKLDELFGEGCCRKVFVGIQSPGMELIMDFFEQITPLLNKFAKERGERINLKYNRNRKGARR